MIKRILVAAMLATSLGATVVPADAAIYLREAPPAPRQEVMPPARRGYVWVPGHWDARGNRYRWVKGNWVRARHGFHYTAPNWVERDGRWYREGGSWMRGDRDGDGIPNGADNNPNNPRRR
ncbi:MAG: hypothetical protein JWL63_634 [Rhodocyclales bacterium]|nr:hypothetical protein [Rhodocyclales bacterium]